jgi:hypothetical protein
MHIRFSAEGFAVHFAILVLLVVPGAVFLHPAHAGNEGNEVRLRSGLIRGPRDRAGLPDRLLLERRDLARGGPALIRFKGTPGAESRGAAETAGIRLAGYLGDGAYVAWLPDGGLELAEALPEIDWAAPLHPGLRLSPYARRIRGDDPRASIPLTLHLFAHADANEVAQRLELLGIQVAGTAAGRPARQGAAYIPGRIVILPEPASWVRLRDRVAAWPELLWIDRRPAYRLLNDAAVWVCQSGLYAGQTTPVHAQGVLGEGQTVGILDTGLDVDMCFFWDALLGRPPTNEGLGAGTPDPLQRKVTIVNFLWSGDNPARPGDWDSHDHGTHVAGTVAGDDLATPGIRDAGDGMAPAAKLVIQDGGYAVDNCADMPALGCPAADLYPFFQQAYAQGARIHSNSYGDRENYTPPDIYSEGSEAADAFMWDHPEMLLVFAAGNNGPGAGTVASPATGKNVLSVGATGHDFSADSVAYFSSWGPTHDGRIKPDVMAPGFYVISADNDNDVNSKNCSLRSMSGTSMAAPTAAGLAALVREYFVDGYYPGGSANPDDERTPSAALVKAALIASAAPMESVTNSPPADEQGWGRVLLDDVLYFPGDSRLLFVHDPQDRFGGSGDSADSFALEVLDSTLPLRVVLAWTDYPSTPAATINLVNDLDLEVESPSGEIYRGNVFVDGASVTGGSADTLNNVEAVRVTSPEAGVWSVRVAPSAIPQPDQGYALVATGRLLAAQFPPLPVDTLRLGRAGEDVDLVWSRPAEDESHGEADRYRIYRSESPTGAWALLEELFDLSAEVEFTDVGGSGGAPLRFYQVIAANGDGDAEPLP